MDLDKFYFAPIEDNYGEYKEDPFSAVLTTAKKIVLGTEKISNLKIYTMDSLKARFKEKKNCSLSFIIKKDNVITEENNSNEENNWPIVRDIDTDSINGICVPFKHYKGIFPCFDDINFIIEEYFYSLNRNLNKEDLTKIKKCITKIYDLEEKSCYEEDGDYGYYDRRGNFHYYEKEELKVEHDDITIHYAEIKPKIIIKKADDADDLKKLTT
jgi:hypothetical protein